MRRADTGFVIPIKQNKNSEINHYVNRKRMFVLEGSDKLKQ